MNESVLSQLQVQPWAMEPMALRAFFMSAMTPQSNLKTNYISQISSGSDTAVIPIRGVLMKSVPSWLSAFGIVATDYYSIQKKAKAASDNPSIKKIVLDIESPGGETSGCAETADVIYAASKKKTVEARIDDLCASAAYWLASQANQITSNPNAAIGSIGVYTVYVDSSKGAEKYGYEVHVIRSGQHKGMGIPGAKITADQIASKQQLIDGLAESFIQAVSRGRKLLHSTIKTLATGELWIAKKALSLGLVTQLRGGTSGESFGFVSMAKELSKRKGISQSEAQRIIAKEQPQVFESYKQSLRT